MAIGKAKKAINRQKTMKLIQTNTHRTSSAYTKHKIAKIKPIISNRQFPIDVCVCVVRIRAKSIKLLSMPTSLICSFKAFKGATCIIPLPSPRLLLFFLCFCSLAFVDVLAHVIKMAPSRYHEAIVSFIVHFFSHLFVSFTFEPSSFDRGTRASNRPR